MNEIANHIRHLLQENDCVIIPNFGGFITHYDSARQIEEEHLFLPPSRAIAFNPLLKINDGLLAQSYMTTYHTSFQDANRRIQRAVKQLSRRLCEDGRVFLPEIGELRFNVRQTYEFFPQNDKIVTPSFYGLESFEMPTIDEIKARKLELQQLQARQREEEERRLRDEQRAAEQRQAEEMLREQKAGRKADNRTAAAAKLPHRPQRLRKTLGYAGALLCLLVLFFSIFTLSSPMDKLPVANPVNVEDRAQVGSPELLNELANKSVVAKIIHESSSLVTDVPATTDPAATHTTESASEMLPAAEVAPANKIYHVIVASVGTERDAEAMAQRLQTEGYAGAKTIIGQGYNRISIGSFETEADAYQMVNQLKTTPYAQAWVLRRK